MPADLSATLTADPGALGTPRRCECLSRRQRRATPMPLARHLVERVLRSSGARRVACLWCATDSAYFFLGLPTDVWCGQVRDARTYLGPWPVVCHPPCGPWGKFRWKSRESREDGERAMAHVHRWGGVVEHPLGSSLFREHGRGGAVVERIDQFAWGHLALKPTLLYWWLRPLDRGAD